jgi:hypothetical protein
MRSRGTPEARTGFGCGRKNDPCIRQQTLSGLSRQNGLRFNRSPDYLINWREGSGWIAGVQPGKARQGTANQPATWKHLARPANLESVNSIIDAHSRSPLRHLPHRSIARPSPSLSNYRLFGCLVAPAASRSHFHNVDVGPLVSSATLGIFPSSRPELSPTCQPP